MTSLANFKELLLKKSEGNEDLQTIIRFVDTDVLSDLLMESLEKMARGRHKGDAANAAVMDFGTEMDPEMEPHMIRDAIGHHVSHYKAALEKVKSAGSDEEKKKAKGNADQHAKQAFKLMNLADTVKKHSHGKLDIDYVPPQPWERNKFTSRYSADHPKVQEGKYKVGDFTTKTKGLNYDGSIFGNDGSNFLEKAPHEAYTKEIKRHGNNGAYPFEQVKVNGKYIPIEDVEYKENLKDAAHPFDSHPIVSSFKSGAASRTPEEDAKYIKERDAYASDPSIEQYWSDKEAKGEDPDSGSKAGKPVHAPVENPLDISAPEAPISSQDIKNSKIKLNASDVANLIRQQKADAGSAPAAPSSPAASAQSSSTPPAVTTNRTKMTSKQYNLVHSALKGAGHSDDHIKTKILHNVQVED